MNIIKKYQEISVHEHCNFISFVTSFDVLLLEDIYMHLTKTKHSGSE